MKESIIFLDIDYVLNESSTSERLGHIKGIDNDKIVLLKEIVDFLNADIVLISTWRLWWNKNLGFSKKAKGKYARGIYLNNKLHEYGLTIADKTVEYNWWERGAEIHEWLNRHPNVKRFVILDDEDFKWRKYELEKYWINTYSPGLITDEAGLKQENVDYIKKHIDDFIR